MNEAAEALRERMRRHGVRTLRFVRTLPGDAAGQAIARQLARSATGVSANYQSACRGRSRAEFIAKLAVTLEEASETEHWFLVLKETGIGNQNDVETLLDESRQLRAILHRSVTTARANHAAHAKSRGRERR